MAEPITETAPETTSRRRPRITAVESTETRNKERHIEILLPIEVTTKFNEWVGDNPIRRKLATDVLANYRVRVTQLGAEAADFDAIFKSIIRCADLGETRHARPSS